MVKDPLENLKIRIEYLKKETQKNDWGDFGDRHIPSKMWNQCYKDAIWFSDMSKLGLPFVSPCGDGSIHMCWFHQDGREFVIEIMPWKFSTYTKKDLGGGLDDLWHWDLRTSDGQWKFGSTSSRSEILELLKNHLK